MLAVACATKAAKSSWPQLRRANTTTQSFKRLSRAAPPLPPGQRGRGRKDPARGQREARNAPTPRGLQRGGAVLCLESPRPHLRGPQPHGRTPSNQCCVEEFGSTDLETDRQHLCTNLGRLKGPCKKYRLCLFCSAGHRGLRGPPEGPRGPSVGLPGASGALPKASGTYHKPKPKKTETSKL